MVLLLVLAVELVLVHELLQLAFAWLILLGCSCWLFVATGGNQAAADALENKLLVMVLVIMFLIGSSDWLIWEVWALVALSLMRLMNSCDVAPCNATSALQSILKLMLAMLLVLVKVNDADVDADAAAASPKHCWLHLLACHCF